MKHIKWAGILLAIALILGIIPGCGIVQVNPEKDRKLVVAEVNGEKILKGEVLDRLDKEKAYYNLTDEDIKDTNNKEQILEIKKDILDQIATEKLLNQKAEESGFVITDELREEARKELEDIKADIAKQLEDLDRMGMGEEEDDEEKSEDELEEKDYAKEAEDYIMEQLRALDMTGEEYIEFLAEQKCIEKLYDKIVEDVDVTSQDIEKYYNDELTSQKENPIYADNRPVVLYEPFKIRVKHIVIEIPEDKASEYMTLINDEKEDEAKTLLDKELKAIKGKADEILDKAKAGEDFEKLAEEVNPDVAEIMKEGIIIHREVPYLPDEYKEEAFKLKKDQISGLVATPQGYFIIKLEEEYPEKTHTLDEKKEDIHKVLESQKQHEKWQQVLEEWKEKQIKKFERRL
jgi:foldase protein PrsA